MHELAIIVVSTNEARWLTPCLSSVLERAGDCSLDLVVADNGSTDGTAELVDSSSRAVSVGVRNIGTRTSREVVQVYYRPAEHDQPVRLVGWRAVTLEPDAAATVLITPEPRMWRRWDEDSHSWRQLSERGELLVARGLGDIRTSVDLL